VKEYSEFVLRFLEKLHVTEPIEIVAHSFGGRIAFYLAAKYPEKVSKLWLMAPGGVERPVSKTKKLMLKLGKNILPQRMQQYLKNRISSVDYQNAGKLLPIFQKVVSEDIRELFPQISQLVYLYW
jgi:pimeloyl-ACP methyl ester carboxylesterase